MTSPRLQSVLFWSLAATGLASSRWPYLSSPLYLLDNDEAVLGIMARRMAEGRELPFFFAGQNYGLAILETAPVAAAFALFGDTPEVMTGTILALFLVGLFLYAHVFGELTGSRAWGRSLALILAMLPGWIVWSTKARGLYVSGFLLTGVLLALLVRPSPTRGRVLVVGALAGLLALVQPLWLVVVAPFAVLAGLGAPGRDVATGVALGMLVWLLPSLAVMGREAFWSPDRIGLQLAGATLVPRSLTRAFSGAVPPGSPTPLTSLVGWVGSTAFFAVLTGLAWSAHRDRSRRLLALAAAMVLSVAHVLVLQYWVPRYFLPATVLTFLGLAMLIGHRSPPFRGGALAGTALALTVLVASSWTMGRPTTDSVLGAIPARTDLGDLIEGLEEDGVRGVYAASSDLQWQLLFYGGTAIPVRGPSLVDRYPEFPRAVERARRSGQAVTLVADVRRLRDQLPELGGFPGYRVGERYLRLDDPSDLVLSLLSFQIPDEVDGP